MEFKEAQALAERMRNQFRAFEKLTEVLALASTAESTIKGSQKQIDKLNKETMDAKDEAKKATKKAEDAKKKFADATKEFDETFSGYCKGKRDEFNTEIHALEAQRQGIINAITAAKEKHEQEIIKIRRDEESAHAALQDIQRRLHDMKSSLP